MNNPQLDPGDIAALFDRARLRMARELRGLTQVQLAREVGSVTAASISQFENGHTKPATSTLLRLAVVLRVPPSFFAAPVRPLPRIRSTGSFAAFGPHLPEIANKRSPMCISRENSRSSSKNTSRCPISTCHASQSRKIILFSPPTSNKQQLRFVPTGTSHAVQSKMLYDCWKLMELLSSASASASKRLMHSASTSRTGPLLLSEPTKAYATALVSMGHTN